MSQTRDQRRFTISEVAAAWHELMIPRGEQLHPRSSQQTYHRPNQPR